MTLFAPSKKMSYAWAFFDFFLSTGLHLKYVYLGGQTLKSFSFPARLDRAYLIKELDGTYVMAHQPEAPTDTTELLTRLTWFTLPGFEPATLKSAA